LAHLGILFVTLIKPVLSGEKAIVKHLDSKNLVPFRKRNNGFRLVGTSSEEEEQMVQEVDPKLRPDEHSYVRHYLSRADTLLNGTEPSESRAPNKNVLKEFPARTAPEEEPEERKKAA
jgi:hypothetical protein